VADLAFVDLTEIRNLGYYTGSTFEVFTREIKPLEVELIVAEVGDDNLAGHENNSIYRVKFDGFISDHSGHCVIGGEAEEVERMLDQRYQEAMPLGEAVRLAREALSRGTNGGGSLAANSLEVCVLERARAGRKFVRLSTDEVQGMLDA